MTDATIEKTDVLIIGAGAAGIRAAYEAKQHGLEDITLLSKGKFIHSGSSFFPLVHGWGMQASMPEFNPDDSPEDHLRETLERGLGVCDEKLARILVEEAGDRVRDLRALGLEFRESNGKISQIVGCFSKGRRAIGAINMESIRKTFRNMVTGPEFKIHDNFMVLDLLVRDSKCLGIIGIDKNGRLKAFQSKACIIASGGGTDVYKHSLQSGECSGDSYGLALRAGLSLYNMEFIQSIFGIIFPKHLIFSERAMFYDPDVTNKNNERFIENYLPAGITYKDVLRERITHGPFSSAGISKWFDIAVFKEIRKGMGTDNDAVKVDLKDYQRVQEENRDNINIKQWSDFTDVWIQWLKDTHGVDVTKQALEIDHSAHAMNGGIKADEETRTDIGNLFVCGEALAGPHGADRLGGNMMTSTQVFGRRAGLFAAETARGVSHGKEETSPARDLFKEKAEHFNQMINTESSLKLSDQRKKLRGLMWNDAHIVRTRGGLARTKKNLSEMLAEMSDVRAENYSDLKKKASLENLLLTGLSITEAALLRKESRGPHYREDYPNTEDSFKKPILLRLKGKEVEGRL